MQGIRKSFVKIYTDYLYLPGFCMLLNYILSCWLFSNALKIEEYIGIAEFVSGKLQNLSKTKCRAVFSFSKKSTSSITHSKLLNLFVLRVKNGIYSSRHESINVGDYVFFGLCCYFKFCHQDMVTNKFKRWLNSILTSSVFILICSTYKNLNKFLIT